MPRPAAWVVGQGHTSPRGDFGLSFYPFRSPLLRVSLLVSFPPLIDMLNFSGYPRRFHARASTQDDDARPTCVHATGCCWASPNGAGWVARQGDRVNGLEDGIACGEHPSTQDMKTDVLLHSVLTQRVERMCVGRTNDSRDPAIRIAFRISRRPSSRHEPSNPSLPV